MKKTLSLSDFTLSLLALFINHARCLVRQRLRASGSCDPHQLINKREHSPASPSNSNTTWLLQPLERLASSHGLITTCAQLAFGTSTVSIHQQLRSCEQHVGLGAWTTTATPLSVPTGRASASTPNKTPSPPRSRQQLWTPAILLAHVHGRTAEAACR